VTEAARIAENPAPYDVLTARAALVEAAKLNRKAVALEAEGSQCMAAWVADVAQSLSTYALALARWNT
jgi:hypothetical protein